MSCACNRYGSGPSAAIFYHGYKPLDSDPVFAESAVIYGSTTTSVSATSNPTASIATVSYSTTIPATIATTSYSGVGHAVFGPVSIFDASAAADVSAATATASN